MAESYGRKTLEGLQNTLSCRGNYITLRYHSEEEGPEISSLL